jgi:hypothetical protein
VCGAAGRKKVDIRPAPRPAKVLFAAVDPGAVEAAGVDLAVVQRADVAVTLGVVRPIRAAVAEV